MGLKNTIIILSFVVTAAIIIIEIFVNKEDPNVWEKFQKKKDPDVDNIEPYSMTFAVYLEKFGKSYKNIHNYNAHKKEFFKSY